MAKKTAAKQKLRKKAERKSKPKSKKVKLTQKPVVNQPAKSVDEAEVAKFSALADEWWNERGKFKPLHKFNPVRVAYIRDKVCEHFGPSPDKKEPLKGIRILDVGCGGGLLAEPLARLGAEVTGIDASRENIEIAAQHASRERIEIDYRHTTVEEISKKKKFDVVMAMEIVEHVADVKSFFESCSELVRPDGMMFVATLNRTFKSFTLAILGAEYFLRWLPVGTHKWGKFLKPSEIERHLRRNDMILKEMQGITYRMRGDAWFLTPDIDVNYIMLAEKKD